MSKRGLLDSYGDRTVTKSEPNREPTRGNYSDGFRYTGRDGATVLISGQGLIERVRKDRIAAEGRDAAIVKKTGQAIGRLNANVVSIDQDIAALKRLVDTQAQQIHEMKDELANLKKPALRAIA